MEREELIKLIMERIYTRRIYAEGLADLILRLFIVVRRSELLNCPYCESSNIQQKTKSDDECKDCGKTWAV